MIALAGGADLQVPDEAAISTITLCELHHGVLRTTDSRRRRDRVAMLASIEREMEALPVDARVAPHFGHLMTEAQREGRRPKAGDVLIAATAMSHGLPLYTRDTDFERMPIPELRIV